MVRSYMACLEPGNGRKPDGVLKLVARLCFCSNQSPPQSASGRGFNACVSRGGTLPVVAQRGGPREKAAPSTDGEEQGEGGTPNAQGRRRRRPHGLSFLLDLHFLVAASIWRARFWRDYRLCAPRSATSAQARAHGLLLRVGIGALPLRVRNNSGVDGGCGVEGEG